MRVGCARVNQYEKGKHAPTVQTSQRLARALLIPTSFLYEEDDLLANLLLIAGRLSKEKKRALVAAAESLAQE